MIDEESLSPGWLWNKHSETRRDPAIIEKMIWALHLLEQLQLSGLPFIFKGGTSLVLLMQKPLRFSVDIDIVVDPAIKKEALEAYLYRVIDNSRFLRVELDAKRSYNGVIPKAHYRFVFSSNCPTKTKDKQVVENPDREILLDVLFENNHYPVTTNCPVQTDWLLVNGSLTYVTTPDINAIAGDKLTAFAPNTIGVPYKKNKEKEIIKQLFDIGTLFDLVDNLQVLKQSFFVLAKNEIGYRPEGERFPVEDVLMDTINTGLVLARRDKQDNAGDEAKFKELSTGINQFQYYVFDSAFRLEHAQLAGAKAAFLAAMILKNDNGPINRFNADQPISEYFIKEQSYNFLNKKLKFVAKGEAIFYWNETIKLLMA